MHMYVCMYACMYEAMYVCMDEYVFCFHAMDVDGALHTLYELTLF